MDRLPVLPLGRIVVYPHVVLPMALTDPHAVQLIDEVVQGNKRLLLGVVRPLGGTEPPKGAVMQARADELYEVGTLGTVVRILKLGDGSVRVMVQGLERARLVEVTPAEHWLVAGYETLPNTVLEDARTEALKRTVHAQFSRVIDIAPYLGEELHEVLVGITEGGKLADFVAANLDLALPAKAELLAIDDVTRRLERLAELLGQELQVLEVGSQIQEKVRTRLDQNQREYVLREQLRVIRQELGEEEGEDELTELASRLEAAGLHDEAKKVVDRELKRLRQMSPQSAEYHVARTYLEVIASLPWGRTSEDRLDLKAARDILDRDHYDLKPVKERILEYLAVRTLNPAARGGVEGADRQVLKDPLLDGLQVVVVAVEDVARGLQVEPVLRRAAPGQRRDHLEVRAGHMVLGRLRRHLAQALELPVDDFLRLVVQAGGLEPAGELGQLVLSLFLAQLLADHPQLLAQHVLPLILIEARAHFLLDLTADLEDLQLLAEQLGEPLEAAVHFVDRQQLGLGREGQVQVRGHEVGQLAGVADADKDLVQLLPQVGGDVDHAGELGVHGALQGFRARVLEHRVGKRLVARHQPMLGGDHLDEPRPLQPLHHDAHRAVAQFEHAHHGAERAHLVQLVGPGLHHRALGRLGAAQRPHHAEQQAFVPLHHLVDQLDGVRIGERHGQHDVRVDDDPAERQDRQAIHLLYPHRLGAGQSGRELRQPDLEEPLLVDRPNALGIDRHGEAEATLERPDLHLHRVIVRLAFVASRGALARDRQDTVHVLDREVLRAHPGDVHVDHQRGVGLVNVRRRLPLGRGDEAHRAAVGDFVEVDLELFRRMHGEGARAAAGPARGRAAIAHGAPPRRPRAPGGAARTAGTARPARGRRPSRARWSRRLFS